MKKAKEREAAKMKKCVMEMSPLGLLQEIYRNDPWKIMVCCIMLNQTSGKQVHQVVHDLFDDYPDPVAMSEANPEVLSEQIKMCGFGNKRAATLIKFSYEYCMENWYYIRELHGIGEYAEHSYRIFVLDEVIEPKDKELKKYIEWLNQQ